MRTSRCRRPSLLGADEPRVPRPQEPRAAPSPPALSSAKSWSPANTVLIAGGGIWGSRVRGGETGGEQGSEWVRRGLAAARVEPIGAAGKAGAAIRKYDGLRVVPGLWEAYKMVWLRVFRSCNGTIQIR